MEIKVIIVLVLFGNFFSRIMAEWDLPIIPSFRMTGGHEARPHSAPYIVLLEVNNRRSCAGCIIDENWILTAAHCVSSSSVASKIIILAGKHDLNNPEKSTVQKRTVNSFYIHKLYIGGAVPYDIALIHIKTPFKWTTAVKPIGLPLKGLVPVGNALLYGWGSTSYTETPQFPNKLQMTTLQILTRKECNMALKKIHSSLVIHETNICTGPLTARKTVCEADSGGPLVDMNGQTLIGIVSWGFSPCGQIGRPSVFVKVSSFIDWIQEIQKKHK